MVEYNWKTKQYEVRVQYRVGGPSVVDCTFWSYEEAVAYLKVRHIKC